MIDNPPHAGVWDAIARRVAAVLKSLRLTAPEAFAAISAEVRAQLILAAALVRRYLHLVAAGIVLPPQRVAAPDAKAITGRSPSRGGWRFSLGEGNTKGGQRTGTPEPPELQWAILLEAARRLAGVIADPLPHARRLARRLRQPAPPALSGIIIPYHVVRRIHPACHTLLLRLDAAARPEAWQDLDPG